MGQCGCGDLSIDKAFQLPKGIVVAYDIYRGCGECHAGPGVSIYIYPNKKSEWLEGVKIESFTPSEDGGDSGNGIPISFFEVSDLANAAKAIGETKLSRDGYRSVEDWLSDYGLQMMQDAMRLFAKRNTAHPGGERG